MPPPPVPPPPVPPPPVTAQAPAPPQPPPPPAPPSEPETMIETIIVGAGPGGLQLAYLMQRAGREYTVLEQADGAGAFFAKYPVHRQLISINKVNTGKADKEFNLRHDWNSLLDEEGYTFAQFSQELFPNADLAVDYLQGYADHHKLKVQYNRRVASIHTENLRSHGEGAAAC